jgi:hypothetical protein
MKVEVMNAPLIGQGEKRIDHGLVATVPLVQEQYRTAALFGLFVEPQEPARRHEIERVAALVEHDHGHFFLRHVSEVERQHVAVFRFTPLIDDGRLADARLPNQADCELTLHVPREIEQRVDLSHAGGPNAKFLPRVDSVFLISHDILGPFG